MNKRQMRPVVIVIAIGAVLAGLILTLDKTPSSTSGEATRETPETKDKPGVSSNTEPQPVKGPKGGKLFSSEGFSVEVTIFETGVPPQFRLYLYENGKPLPPSSAHVILTVPPRRLCSRIHIHSRGRLSAR